MTLPLSFRTKLILSIFPVIAGITTAVLVIAERKFSGAQKNLFAEQFEGQFGALLKSRKERSDTLGKDLREMSKAPELISALKDKRPADAWTYLLPKFEKMAFETMNPSRPIQGATGDAVGPQGKFPLAQRIGERLKGSADRAEPKLQRLLPGMMPFMGIVDPQGDFLKVQRGKQSGERMAETEGELHRRSGRLKWLADRNLGEVLKVQEVGYLLVEAGEGKPSQVREIFVTPVRSDDGKEFFGAFVFGLPLPANQERAIFEQSKHNDLGRFMSGVWVEDTLVSGTVPDAKKDEIAKIVGDELDSARRHKRELTVTIDGERQQVLYRVLNPDSPFPIAAQVSFYPLATLEREIADLRRTVAGLGIAAMALALLLVLWISRGLAGPLRQLCQGTVAIEQGDYGFRVQVKSRDELGTLAASFNEMAAGLAQREKYHSVLNAVADPAVARELMENKAALGGEVREVSVLFCDIRGFTALTEGMPPHDVIDLLNEHMTALTHVAYAHGGIVDKFVGDLVMVLFGVPQAAGDDVARAVRCAWEMLTVRRALNETTMHPVEVGIGIATGAVVAGCMGSEQRLSYTVVGERVNLASRLCSTAQAGELIIDEATLNKSRSSVEATSLPPVLMKGFKEPVRTFRVTSVTPG